MSPRSGERAARGVAAGSARSIVDVLRRRAQSQPSETLFTVIADSDGVGRHLTFAELDGRARAIASRLSAEGLRGERALLLYPAGLEFVEAFFGCLYAGVVAVPAFPPRANRTLGRLAAIASDADACAALSPADILPRSREAVSASPALACLRWIATDEPGPDGADISYEPREAPSLAYLQYTSGSTSDPKGVMVSHANLLSNSEDIRLGFGHTRESRSLSWLPHFHDMGLVDGIIQPVYAGFAAFLMAPASFLQSPARWLEAISRHGITHSGGPNFAYDLCARRVEPDADRLRLHSWTVATNGAEPIRAETLERFVSRFSSCGFRRESFYPAYGLAEATLKVSGGSRGGGALLVRVGRSALEKGRVEQTAERERTEIGTGEHGSSTVALVGCGRAGASTRVAIVDPETHRERRDGEVGEIWVSGPGVALGYWNRSGESETTFGARLAVTRPSTEHPGPPTDGARFLRTGDLGFVRGGELFVAGRLKDLVIIRGRNIYPQDVERTAESSHAALRPGGGASFGVDVGGEERLVLVHEVDRHGADDAGGPIAAIRAAIVETHEVDPHAIVLVGPAGVPRTSSGKVRRAACRKAFLEGSLPVVAEWRAPDAPGAAAPGPPEATPLDLSREGTRAWIAGRVASKLGVAAGAIDFDAPLARLGLDSLRSIELAHEIEQRFGAAVSAAELLAAPSLSAILARISPVSGESSADGDGGPREPAGEAAAAPLGLSIPTVSPARGRGLEGEPEACPLSAGQRALWFLQELAPESTAYTIAAALRLTGPLDEDAFERAARALVARHASLRARIDSPRGEPRQRFDVPFEAIYERRNLRDASREALAARLADEADRRFDLAGGPLFRLALSELRDDRVLLVTAHHTVADLWSLSLVLGDLRALYAEELALGPGAGGPPPHPAEFVCWQERLLAGEEGERQFAFWHQRLAGEPPALDLPADRPRPPVKTFRGGVRMLRIEPRLARALGHLARSRGVTKYALLLAAYEAFLRRITGQRELLVGSPASGRTVGRFAGLVAYLVNTLVHRADLSDDPSFDDLVRASAEGVVAALGHQDYPFPMVVKRLAPARLASRSPIFDTLFDFHGASDLVRGDLTIAGRGARTEFAGGVVAEPLAIERRAAQFDLAVTATESGEGLSVEFEYNSDLFDAPTVDRLARGFEALLGGVTADPSARVSRLPLLAPGERATAVSLSNARPASDPVECFHRLFAREAERAPEAVAAWHCGTALSYGELNRRANAVARSLRRAGIGPEARVAVSIEKSPDLVVALMGVLKAGGAYVPVDPSLPAARRRFLVADSGARVVLVRGSRGGERAAGPPEDFGPGVMRLDLSSGGNECAALDGPGPDSAGDADGGVSPGNLAYVIYTSGTTGTPKGVGVTHASLVGAFRAWDRAYDLRALRTHLQLASPGFDVFTGDLVRALGSGGALVLVDRETLLDPPALAALARAHGCEFGDFVPAPLRELAAHLARTGERLDSFRIVIIGSDAWTMDDLASFRGAFGIGTPLLNSYGVTEATIDSILDDGTDPPAGRLAPPIGRPLANTAGYVLDENLEPVPAGVRGELYIGGPAVARGYVGRPDLTAERFLPDPHGEHGSRMYRTGDAARRLADGRIEFLGRFDAQVKIRGYRVEPVEIEAALESHPDVRACVVVAREHAGGRRLAAYTVLRAPHADASAALRSHVADRLPEYMVPSAVVVLEELPLSPNGKVDRRALPEPDWGAAGRVDDRRWEARGGDEPATDAERVLAGAWGNVLGLARVGRDQDFFELGGDSILVIQVVARAREAGLRLTPRMVFEHPTIAGLAGAAERFAKRPSAAAEEPPAPPWVGEAPLTPIQRWFFEEAFDGSSHWNMAVAFDAREGLDGGIVRRAAQALVDHHDALRARFEPTAEGRRQVIEPPGAREAACVEFEIETSEDAEAAVARCAQRLARSLDIEHGPVVGFGLVTAPRPGPALDGASDDTLRPQRAGARSTLVLVAHHLVVDGLSIRTLVEDFDRAYLQASLGGPIALPPRTAAVGAWVASLARAVREGRFDGETDHWRRLARRLAPGVPPPPGWEALGDEVCALEETTAVETSVLGERETAAILRSSAATGAGVEVLLLAALAAAWGRRAAGAPLFVEVEGHGRDAPVDLDVTRTVGWFTATRPVLVDGVGPSDPAGAVAGVARELRAVSSVGFLALRHLSPDPEVRDDLRRLARPPMSFNYLGGFDAVLPSGSRFERLREPASAQRSPHARRTHPLEIDAMTAGGSLVVRWSYSRAQLDPAAVAHLVRDFLAELRRMAGAPVDPLTSAHDIASKDVREVERVKRIGKTAEVGDRAAIRLAPPAGFSPKVGERDAVESLLPLTPMQEGMLFHHVRGEGRDPYVSQIALTLTGEVDAGWLELAWRRAFAVHPALCSEFVWKDVERPIQRIRRRIELPVTLHEGAGATVEDVMARAREDGFDVSRAPLARVDLVRTGARQTVIVFTHHHLLLDGWSLPVVFRSVFEAYDAQAEGPGRASGEPRVERAREIETLRRHSAWLGSADPADADRFFRRYLEGFATPTPAPDPACATRQATSGDTDSRVAHGSAPEGVVRRARALGLTPSTVVQAAWAMVLAASGGARDVVFGATSSGRPPEIDGIESLVALCINTLPVRAKVSAAAPAREWMHELQRRGAELRQYEYAPLAQVQKCAATAANTPLFETLLVFENYPIDVATLGRRGRFEVTAIRLHEETNYPLTIVAAGEKGLRFRAIYDRSRLDEPGVRLLLERLSAAIDGLLSRPDALLGEISVLAPGERRRLLRDWNDTHRDYPRDATIVEVFDAVARDHGADVALVFDGGSMTYAALRARALAVGAALRSRGVGAETRVALAMVRSPELVAAILGVLYAGGAYVPLDSESPPSRTERMLADARAALVVTDGRTEFDPLLRDLCASTGGNPAATTVDIVSFSELAEGRPGACGSMGPGAAAGDDVEGEGTGRHAMAHVGLDARRGEGADAGPDSLAYVMFTSGSTGAPKGIEVTNRGVLRLVLGTDYIRFAPDQTILHLASPAFDAATFEIWGALLHGARIAIAPPGVATPAEIAKLFVRDGVTAVFLTTGLFNVVADEEPEALARVAAVITGGEVGSPARFRRLLASGCPRVVHAYGPTESTTFACCDALLEGDEIGEHVPIGRAIANTRVHVLDDGLGLAPIGAPGELCIGGDGLARGYAHRPDLTAERFVPDPYGPPGSRLYRTGDNARWRSDGRVEFLGRRDGQVKVRGFRVELGEVEAALAAAPGVGACAVIVRGEAGATDLVGCVVADGTAASDPAALRAALSERLPRYMVPSRFVLLDALPLNANGKVDRRALAARAVDTEPFPTPGRHLPGRPLSPVESAVADLWRRVLDLRDVGPDDDFFEVGGHSLHATRLLAAVRRSFRVELPMAALFEATTVAGLARALVANEPEPGHVERAARALARLREMANR